MHICTVATPSYLARHSTPQDPEQLRLHNLVAGQNGNRALAWRFNTPSGPLEIEPKGNIRANDAEAVRAAALSGLGIAHDAQAMFQPDLDEVAIRATASGIQASAEGHPCRHGGLSPCAASPARVHGPAGADGRFGKLDVLVNNAGIAIQDHWVDDPELDGEKYNQQWQVNFLGTIANTRAAAPRLTDGSRIIFIGSLLGTAVPFPGVADYAGTK